MATSAGLRSEFEYQLEYDTSARGLDEFEAEDERAAFTPVEQGGAVNVRLNWLETRAPSRRWRRYVMPVAAAAVVVAAVAWFVTTQSVAWVGTTSSVVAPAPNAPSAPAPTAARSAAVPPAVAVSEAVVEPREVVREGARPAAEPQPRQAAPDPSRVALETPRVVPKAPRAAPAPVRAAIGDTLAGVGEAYRRLDAAALGGVWPGADAATLSRQFSSLKYQALSFDACDVRATAPDQAIASCAVSIAAAPKEGDPSLQHRREAWTIVLARQGDRYLITGVSIR
jgi:hypothetical protein